WGAASSASHCCGSISARREVVWIGMPSSLARRAPEKKLFRTLPIRRAEFIRPASDQERRLLLSPLQECFAALRRQQVPHLLQRGQSRIAVRQGSRGRGRLAQRH